MMTETLGFVFKDALIGSQCRFAALQKRRKTVPDECDELVTILSLALWGQLTITHFKQGLLHSLPNKTNTLNMTKFKSKLRLASIAASALAVSSTGAFAATDDAYSTNDLLLFSQNPGGTTGTDKVVYYSLGSTYNVFRDAATPSSANFGSTISLGNIGGNLTSTFGADWTNLTSTIFFGAAGQNGNVNAASTTISNGDLARTVYVTKARSGVGSVGQANSASPLFDPAQTGVAGQISGSNAISGMTQPGVVAFSDTLLDGYNPISSGNPGTAYGAINGGIMQSVGSNLTFASIEGVVLLDLYRVTKTSGTNGASVSAWQNANGITATYSDNTYPGSNSARADYLGTIGIAANGDVNFAAVPEPSTYALIALSGILYFFVNRRRKSVN
jgi:hypothetical protein